MVIVIAGNEIKKIVINMNQNNQTINREYAREMLITYLIHLTQGLAVAFLFMACLLKEFLASSLHDMGTPHPLFSRLSFLARV